jgi:glycerol kinase
VFADFGEISRAWALDRRFEPDLGAGVRDALYEGWIKAVERVR